MTNFRLWFLLLCLCLPSVVQASPVTVLTGDTNVYAFNSVDHPFWAQWSQDGNGDCHVGWWVSGLGGCDVSGFYDGGLHETPAYLGTGTTTFKVDGTAEYLYGLTAWQDSWGIDDGGCVWIQGNVGQFSSCDAGNHFVAFEVSDTCVVIGMEDNEGATADFDRQDRVIRVCGGSNGGFEPKIDETPESSSLILLGTGLLMMMWLWRRKESYGRFSRIF